MKILNKIKNLFLWIIGIFGSIFLIFKVLGQKKENVNTERLKGQNDILDKNLILNNEKLEKVDDNIISVKKNIEEIKKETNSESLDDFFDKRGF